MAITYSWKINNGVYTFITDPSMLNDEGEPSTATYTETDMMGYISYSPANYMEKSKLENFVSKYLTNYSTYAAYFNTMVQKLRAYNNKRYAYIDFPSAEDCFEAETCSDFTNDIEAASGDSSTWVLGGSLYAPTSSYEDGPEGHTTTYANNSMFLNSLEDEGKNTHVVNVMGGFTSNYTAEQISGITFTEFVNILLFGKQLVFPQTSKKPSVSLSISFSLANPYFLKEDVTKNTGQVTVTITNGTVNNASSTSDSWVVPEYDKSFKFSKDKRYTTALLQDSITQNPVSVTTTESKFNLSGNTYGEYNLSAYGTFTYSAVNSGSTNPPRNSVGDPEDRISYSDTSAQAGWPENIGTTHTGSAKYYICRNIFKKIDANDENDFTGTGMFTSGNANLANTEFVFNPGFEDTSGHSILIYIPTGCTFTLWVYNSVYRSYDKVEASTSVKIGTASGYNYVYVDKSNKSTEATDINWKITLDNKLYNK